MALRQQSFCTVPVHKGVLVGSFITLEAKGRRGGGHYPWILGLTLYNTEDSYGNVL